MAQRFERVITAEPDTENFSALVHGRTPSVRDRSKVPSPSERIAAHEKHVCGDCSETKRILGGWNLASLPAFHACSKA